MCKWCALTLTSRTRPKVLRLSLAFADAPSHRLSFPPVGFPVLPR